MVNPPGNEKARYQVAKECPEHPQEWLRHAENCHGPWWPDYASWLAERCGEERAGRHAAYQLDRVHLANYAQRGVDGLQVIADGALADMHRKDNRVETELLLDCRAYVLSAAYLPGFLTGRRGLSFAISLRHYLAQLGTAGP
jgi:hypothetical protein